MNLSQIKTNARTNGVCNPEVIGEYLKRLAKCRITDLFGEPTAVMRISTEIAQREPDYPVLNPAEQAQRLNTISGTVTLSDALELVAKHCGGNTLRPYLNYLNIGEEKFRGYRFPPDVNQIEELKKQGFEPWSSEPPCKEPEIFMVCDEDGVEYNGIFDEDDDEILFEPDFIEAPEVSFPDNNQHPKEPIIAALDCQSTFCVLNDLLRSLLFITT